MIQFIPHPPPAATDPAVTLLRGDLAIRGLVERGTTAIIDVRVTNLDSQTHRGKSPKQALQTQENEKKSKYQGPCDSRRESFYPFVASVDGMFGPAANQLIDLLSVKHSEKYQLHLSQSTFFVRRRLTIALVRATHLCLRGSRVIKNFLPKTGPSFMPP